MKGIDISEMRQNKTTATARLDNRGSFNTMAPASSPTYLLTYLYSKVAIVNS